MEVFCFESIIQTYFLSVAGVVLFSILFLFVLKQTSGVEQYFPKIESMRYRLFGFFLSCLIVVLFFMPGWIALGGNMGIFETLTVYSEKYSIFKVTQLLWELQDVQNGEFGFITIDVDNNNIYMWLILAYLPIFLAFFNGLVSFIKPSIGSFFYTGFSLLIWVGACMSLMEKVDGFVPLEPGFSFIVSAGCMFVVMFVTPIELLVHMRTHLNFLLSHLAGLLYLVLGFFIQEIATYLNLSDELLMDGPFLLYMYIIPFILVEIFIYLIYKLNIYDIRKKVAKATASKMQSTPVDETDKNIIYCSNCGTKCKSYMRYCPGCGHEIKRDSEN